MYTIIISSNVCPRDAEDHLYTELNNLNEWLRINQLSLKVKKSKYILPKICEHFNLLGVAFQENLSWDIHIKLFHLNAPHFLLVHILILCPHGMGHGVVAVRESSSYRKKQLE